MAKKQEQEPADPEVTEVARGVLRMQLPIRMPGLGHVNMYALLDDDGVALVDPGLPGPSTWKAIKQRLKQAQLEVRHVHTVVITHSHPDHFGGAARLAREAGAEIVGHREFRFGVLESRDDPEVSVDDLTGEADDAEHAAAIQRWNTRTPWGGEHPRPGFRTRMKWRAARLLGRSFIPTVSRPVGEGDVVRMAGREWFVRHTPGHTEDHICLFDPDEGVFLAGDHVLPTITPHISGISLLAKDPLAITSSTPSTASAEIPGRETWCLPAHGHPFDDLAAPCRGHQAPSRTSASTR